MAAFSGKLLADPILTSVSVGSQTPDPVQPGSNATYVVTVTRTNSGSMDIYLSVSGLPAGAHAVCSPNPVKFNNNSGTSASAQMVISTTRATPPGYNPFSLLADDGASHNKVAAYAALDVTMSSPGIARMNRGCICVAFEASTNTECHIQATTNLIAPQWDTLCVTNSGTYSLMVFADMDAPKYPCRFYRLTMP